MKKQFNKKFNRYVYELFAGDFHAVKENNIAFTTLLGSCISVCIKDTSSNVSGLNHFMLPSKVTNGKELVLDADARYGINSMELMINEMMKLGAQRRYLRAKVFGGGQVMDNALNNVARSNIEFIFAYLEMESIPILARDVGGNNGRKIFFFPDDFTVFVKRISYNKTLETAVAREKDFLKWMRKKRQQESELTLFE